MKRNFPTIPVVFANKKQLRTGLLINSINIKIHQPRDHLHVKFIDHQYKEANGKRPDSITIVINNNDNTNEKTPHDTSSIAG